MWLLFRWSLTTCKLFVLTPLTQGLDGSASQSLVCIPVIPLCSEDWAEGTWDSFVRVIFRTGRIFLPWRCLLVVGILRLLRLKEPSILGGLDIGLFPVSGRGVCVYEESGQEEENTLLFPPTKREKMRLMSARILWVPSKWR